MGSEAGSPLLIITSQSWPLFLSHSSPYQVHCSIVQPGGSPSAGTGGPLFVAASGCIEAKASVTEGMGWGASVGADGGKTSVVVAKDGGGA